MADSERRNDESSRELSRRELFRFFDPRRSLVSLGRLVIDPASCSACGLCSSACPRKALVAEGEDCLDLVFDGTLCDSCGKCLEVCPEKAIKGEAATGSETTRPVLLFRDQPARCLKCGAIIGSKAMISRVSFKLQQTDPRTALLIQHCQSCRSSVAK